MDEIATPDVEQDFEDTVQTELSEEGRAALESTVADKLAAFNNGTLDSDIREEGVEPDDLEEEQPGEAGAEEQDDNTPAESDTEVDDSTATQEAATEGTDPDAPTLPDPVRRSLYAYGWTDENIDRNLKALGAQFLDTATRLHDNRNQETATMAAAGRRALSGAGDSAAPASDDPPQILQRVDVAALKEVYGDDEALIDAITGPVNATIDKLNAALPHIQQGFQTATSTVEQQLRSDIEAFFTGDDTKGYDAVYGGNGTFNEEQSANRNKVLETADYLIEGARIQGRSLTVQQALLAAHDHVSRDFKETAIRTTITKEAKKRNRGITQKPAGAAAATKPSAAKSRSALEKKISGKLNELFA